MPFQNLRNHIHLSETLQTTGEKAPDLKWVITDRLDIPVRFMSLKRTIGGKLKAHRLYRNGQLVQLTNFKYTIRVEEGYGYTLEQRVAQLKALDGKSVYLCDIVHPADGADHSSAIKPYIVARVSEFPPIGPGLQYFNVDVELEDASL